MLKGNLRAEASILAEASHISACEAVEYERQRLQNQESFLSQESLRRDIQHQQRVIQKHKQLDDASEQKSRRNKVYRKKRQCCEKKIDESSMLPKSMLDWTPSEQHEEIHELKFTSIALQGSLKETEKSLDQVTLSLDRRECLVKRLTQQNRDLQHTANVLQEAAGLKDPEPVSSEVSGQTVTTIVMRNHVSGANFAGRNVANSLSRDVLGSLVFP